MGAVVAPVPSGLVAFAPLCCLEGILCWWERQICFSLSPPLCGCIGSLGAQIQCCPVVHQKYFSIAFERTHDQESHMNTEICEYLCSFRAWPLTVPSGLQDESPNTCRTIAEGEQDRLNPRLDVFQRHLAQVVQRLLRSRLDGNEDMAWEILGYLTPFDVLKREKACNWVDKAYMELLVL